MSVASRLAAADTRIEKPAAGSNLGLNSGGVPGGISAVPIDGPLYVGGQKWTADDAEPWAASIGYQLALELALELSRPRVDLVKAGRS